MQLGTDEVPGLAICAQSARFALLGPPAMRTKRPTVVTSAGLTLLNIYHAGEQPLSIPSDFCSTQPAAAECVCGSDVAVQVVVRDLISILNRGHPQPTAVDCQPSRFHVSNFQTGQQRVSNVVLAGFGGHNKFKRIFMQT